jgi:hypothetical protein
MGTGAVERLLLLPALLAVCTGRYYDSSRGPDSQFLVCAPVPESKRQYPGRLKVFLHYLKLEGISSKSKQRRLPPWLRQTHSGRKTHIYGLSRHKKRGLLVDKATRPNVTLYDIKQKKTTFYIVL